MFLALATLAADVPTVDVVKAIKDNDLFGQILLLALTALSIYSFTIIFQKWAMLRAARAATRSFQRHVEEDGSWDALFAAAKKHGNSPNANLLKEIYVECRVENWFENAGRGELGLEARLALASATIEGTVQRTITHEEEKLLSKLNVLSTITTLAPLLGLFGTVWGVLASFQAIGAEGGASISALAPGISTALMTTIFGLLAAIPALVAYNHFAREARDLTTQMESFSHELENAVRRQILRGEGGKKA